MSTWYRSLRHIIEEVEVEKFTDKSVWVRVNRPWRGMSANTLEKITRTSSYSRYYPTWSEAHENLMERYTSRVASLKNQTNDAISTLSQIKKMKNPGE